MREIVSNIESIRRIEDCIRATRKYTEGIFTMKKQHPVQGNGFPSKVFCKYYEVYPEAEVPDDTRPAKEIAKHLKSVVNWLRTPAIALKFFYDYRIDKAKVEIANGDLWKLKRAIPHFTQAIYSIKPYNKEGSNNESRVPKLQTASRNQRGSQHLG